MDWNKFCCQEQQQNRVDKERQAVHQEAVMEQKVMNESIKNNSDLLAKDLQEKHDQIGHDREDIANFLHDREVSKEKDRQFELCDDKRIEDQVQMVLDRSFNAAEEKKTRLDEKTAKNQVVCEAMEHTYELKQNRDDARTLRHLVEDKAKYDQYNIDEKDRTDAVNKMVGDSLNSQMEAKRVAIAEEKAEAVAYRKETESKMAEEDAKELEEKRKLREKNMAYQQDLLKQMEEDRARKLAEKISYNA